MLLFFMSFDVPAITCLPSTNAMSPWPAIAWNSFGSFIFTFLFLVSLTIDCPNGCSDRVSADATKDNRSFSAMPFEPITMMSVTDGSPFVSVPVLSTTTAFILWAVSSEEASLIRTPFSAPLPVPTIIDIGTARPRASGQETMRTDTNVVMSSESEYSKQVCKLCADVCDACAQECEKHASHMEHC